MSSNHWNRVIVLTKFAILSILWINSLCISQTQRTAKKPDDFNLTPEEEKSALTIVQPPGLAFESAVVPEEYYVGPSDVISVNIWMSPPLSLTLTVTPEGTLIIPTIGELRVADRTLATVKRDIVNKVREKYLISEITATLIKPRSIIVSVAGNVLHEGLFTLNAVDRATKALEEANKLSRLQTQDDLVPILKGMSTRNIFLRHRDGSQERVDIPKYNATHENRWNPYLREGDMIVVPKKNRMTNAFAVYGEINAPGRYEFVEGDSLLTAIQIAHGMTHQALGERSIFSRMSKDGTTLTTQTINIPEIIAGREPNPPLEPGDRIIIQQRPEGRGDFNVDIMGEVLYPGTYPITRANTHLSEVIRQAGGFTEGAALSSAEVSRQSQNLENIANERMLSLRGQPLSNDSAGYSVETDLRIQGAPVTVDFERLFLQKDTSQDIVLQAEDQIVIPSRQKTVYVFGQVGSPGHLPFRVGKDAKYYVAKAGGFTDRANGGGLRIIKAKTKLWLEPGATKVEEGDYIWVPSEPDRPFSYYMTIASQSAAVLSVIIGVAFIVQQSRK